MKLQYIEVSYEKKKKKRKKEQESCYTKGLPETRLNCFCDAFLSYSYFYMHRILLFGNIKSWDKSLIISIGLHECVWDWTKKKKRKKKKNKKKNMHAKKRNKQAHLMTRDLNFLYIMDALLHKCCQGDLHVSERLINFSWRQHKMHDPLSEKIYTGLQRVRWLLLPFSIPIKSILKAIYNN